MRKRVVVAARAVVGFFVGAVVVGGCVEDGAGGTTGVKGKVVFQTALAQVFTTPVGIGSHFTVTFSEKNDDVDLSKSASLIVDVDGDGNEGNADIVKNEDGGFDVTLTKAGSVHLAVDDGGVVDFINVEARTISDTSIVDAAVLAASDVVDARVPEDFAIIAGKETTLLVSAVDSCATGVIDLGASALVVVVEEGVDAATVADIGGDGVTGFVVEPQDGVDGFVLELQSPGLSALRYNVDVVDADAIDEVHAEVASVDSQAGTARMWGRAFANDVDVIGLEFDWSSDPRVALDLVRGAAVTASISFPTDGTVDDRPAVVTAEVVGESDSVDLLALQEGSLVVARGAVPVREDADDDAAADDAASDDGCAGGGAGTCSAAFVVSAFVLRRRRG